jgi:nitrogen fixation protein FixH
MSRNPAQAREPGFRVTGVHVFGGVVLFFAAIIAVDAGFTVMAIKTFPGQVSVTPYEDGLLYNARIAQLRSQNGLGWRAAASAAPGAVVLEYRDRDGLPVRGLTVTGKLERPATEAGRIALRFEEVEPGRYLARSDGLVGAWDMSSEARGPQGALFTAERRLTWP